MPSSSSQSSARTIAVQCPSVCVCVCPTIICPTINRVSRHLQNKTSRIIISILPPGSVYSFTFRLPRTVLDSFNESGSNCHLFHHVPLPNQQAFCVSVCLCRSVCVLLCVCAVMPSAYRCIQIYLSETCWRQIVPHDWNVSAYDLKWRRERERERKKCSRSGHFMWANWFGFQPAALNDWAWNFQQTS